MIDPPPAARILPLLLSLLTPACTKQAQRANLDEVLCAAESLYMARQPGLVPAESDRLRQRVSRFRDMLPRVQREEATTRIEMLADSRGESPLASGRRCDALFARGRQR